MDDSLMNFLHSLETSLLTKDHPINFDKSNRNIETLKNSSISKALDLILDHLCDQNYSKVLDVDLSNIGLSFNVNEELFNFINSDDAESNLACQFILLFIGLSALNEFVRINICGPSSGEKETLQTTIFNSEPFQLFSSLDFTNNYLSKYGEFPAGNTLFPNLLCVSCACFQSMGLKVDLTNTRRWWLLRCKILHQRILPEKIASFYEEMVSLSKELIEMDWIKKEKSLLVLAHVEIEQMHLLYDRVSLAETALKSAQKLTDLSIELSGAYGKKTHFQQKLVPQLFVKVQRDETDSLSKSSDESNLETLLSRVKLEDIPPDLPLQDDTLLNDVDFTSGDTTVGCVPELTPQEELVLFGKCFLLNKTTASDDLKLDEMSPFIRAILSIPHSSWAVRYSTLALRCRLECKSSRRADRALRQLDALLACTQQSDPPFHVRSYSLYAAATPLKSDMEGNLADLLVSVGAIKSALEVFQRIGRWEEVVNCLQQLGRKKEAVEILRERLAREETPLLFCLLGDVLDDPEMYRKAGKLSEAPNPRSLRSLGFYYYRRKEYKDCIPFFQQSVAVNYLQPQVWFALGYAALQIEEYDLAAKAYRQVVSLEADDFQAWNNLSHAYIRCKQKKRAWSSLQEAIKCNYEEWRVWENFLLVSVDVGAFDDAIRAYHRLLDLKDKKHVDLQVLEILVTAVIEDVKDINGSSASRLKRQLQKLFGRLTSKVKKNGEVWKLYSMLTWPDLDQDVDFRSMRDVESAWIYQHHALVCCSSINTWPSEFNSFKNVLEMCLRDTKIFILILAASGDEGLMRMQKNIVKLSTNGIISRSEQGLINFQDKEEKELRELLNSLITAYDECINL